MMPVCRRSRLGRSRGIRTVDSQRAPQPWQMLPFWMSELSIPHRRATGGKERSRGAYTLGAVQGALDVSRLVWAAWAVWQVRTGERLGFSSGGHGGWRDAIPGALLSCMKHPPLDSAGAVMVDKPRALFTIRRMNENASALGKLAKGKPKKLTPEQRAASADRMRAAQKLRWKNKARQDQAA